MRKYVFCLMAVLIVVLTSLIFKYHNTIHLYHFPVPESLKEKSTDVPLYMFLYFSRKNCMPCVLEVIEVLDTLPSQFLIAGIVPEEELKDEEGLRRSTGVTFPLFNYTKFKKYLPWYTPTLFGVSPSGKIIFVLPGIEGQRDYLRNIITSIYGGMYRNLAREQITGDEM